jgi:hypothetical protein
MNGPGMEVRELADAVHIHINVIRRHTPLGTFGVGHGGDPGVMDGDVHKTSMFFFFPQGSEALDVESFKGSWADIWRRWSGRSEKWKGYRGYLGCRHEQQLGWLRLADGVSYIY